MIVLILFDFKMTEMLKEFPQNLLLMLLLGYDNMLIPNLLSVIIHLEFKPHLYNYK